MVLTIIGNVMRLSCVASFCEIGRFEWHHSRGIKSFAHSLCVIILTSLLSWPCRKSLLPFFPCKLFATRFTTGVLKSCPGSQVTMVVHKSRFDQNTNSLPPSRRHLPVCRRDILSVGLLVSQFARIFFMDVGVAFVRSTIRVESGQIKSISLGCIRHFRFSNY